MVKGFKQSGIGILAEKLPEETKDFLALLNRNPKHTFIEIKRAIAPDAGRYLISRMFESKNLTSCQYIIPLAKMLNVEEKSQARQDVVPAKEGELNLKQQYYLHMYNKMANFMTTRNSGCIRYKEVQEGFKTYWQDLESQKLLNKFEIQVIKKAFQTHTDKEGLTKPLFTVQKLPKNLTDIVQMLKKHYNYTIEQAENMSHMNVVKGAFANFLYSNRTELTIDLFKGLADGFKLDQASQKREQITPVKDGELNLKQTYYLYVYRAMANKIINNASQQLTKLANNYQDFWQDLQDNQYITQDDVDKIEKYLQKNPILSSMERDTKFIIDKNRVVNEFRRRLRSDIQGECGLAGNLSMAQQYILTELDVEIDNVRGASVNPYKSNLKSKLLKEFVAKCKEFGVDVQSKDLVFEASSLSNISGNAQNGRTGR